MSVEDEQFKIKNSGLPYDNHGSYNDILAVQIDAPRLALAPLYGGLGVERLTGFVLE